MEQVAQAIIEWHRAKNAAEQAEQDLADAQERAINAMKKAGLDKAVATDDNDRITASLVEATRIVIDEGRLKKSLGALKWKKVTKQVLDKDKLEVAIATKEVDPNVVAVCSEEIPNKPYLRRTVKVLKRRSKSAAAKRIGR